MTDRERVGHLGRPTNAHLQIIPLIERYGWTRGAEIGVLRGKTFFALLEACPELYLIGVDQWKVVPFRDAECAETYSGYPMTQLRQDVMDRGTRLNAREHKERATIIPADSSLAADMVADASLDFVFIDADHTEAGCERDLLAWAPKVNMNGMVLGHDWNWPTVRRVLDRRCPGWNGLEDEVWCCDRRRVKLG